MVDAIFFFTKRSRKLDKVNQGLGYTTFIFQTDLGYLENHANFEQEVQFRLKLKIRSDHELYAGS